jgi:hypothetical protein
MAKFLEQWYDPHSNATEPKWTDWEDAQIERLQHTILMAHFAMQIPRRLPNNATPDALADDKKFSKVLRNRLLSQLRTWGLKHANVDELILAQDEDTLNDTRADGASVDWHQWFAQYALERRADLTLVASTTLNGNAKLGNQLAQRIYNELNVVNAIYEEILEA